MTESYCDVCGRRRSWGCGHTEEQEAAAREHAKTEEHLSGACLHYDHSECDPAVCKNHGVSTPGYVAFIKHADAQKKEITYDPTTCITAGELRSMGMQIPETIPDCGWIPRFGMKMERCQTTEEDGVLRVSMEARFTVPFKWIAIDIKVDL